MAKEMILTDEQTERLDSMIWKIVWKKKKDGSYSNDVEDMHAECWIAAMEAIQKKGELDFNYVASACMYRIVDVVRKNVRQQFTTIDIQQFDRMVDSDSRCDGMAKDSQSDFDTYDFVCARQEKVEEHIELMSLLDLFKDREDPREGKYVELHMIAHGIINSNEYGEVPERAIDNWVAKNLGYAASKSGGYAKLRDRVRNVIVAAGYYTPEWAR